MRSILEVGRASMRQSTQRKSTAVVDWNVILRCPRAYARASKDSRESRCGHPSRLAQVGEHKGDGKD